MSNKPENPPAFPMPDQYTPQGQPVMQGSGGMSLRDYFAGQAASAILSGIPQTMRYEPWSVALDAYEMADAMLERRAKEPRNV